MGPARGKLSACSRPPLTQWKRPTPVCSLRRRKITLKPHSSSEHLKRKNVNHQRKNQMKNRFRIRVRVGGAKKVESERRKRGTVTECEKNRCVCYRRAQRYVVRVPVSSSHKVRYILR